MLTSPGVLSGHFAKAYMINYPVLERSLRTNKPHLIYKMAAVLGSVLVGLLFISISLAAKDVFHEELLLRPLKTGHVYAHFQFTTIWDVDIRDSKACEYADAALITSSNIELNFIKFSEEYWFDP